MTQADVVLQRVDQQALPVEEFRWPSPTVLAEMSAEKFRKAGTDRAKWSALGVRLARIHHNWNQLEQRLSKSVIERLFKECPFRIVALEFSVKTGLEMVEAAPVRLVVDNTKPKKAKQPQLRRSKTPEEKAAAAKRLKDNREARANKNRERAHGGTGGGKKKG
jgi:hypothetical protein